MSTHLHVLGSIAHKLIWVCAAAAIALVVSATTVGFLGEAHWSLDLLAAFRVQYVFALLVSGAVALLLRGRWLTVAVVAGLALNIAVIVPLFLPAVGPQPAPTGQTVPIWAAPSSSPIVPPPTLDLLMFNVFTGNPMKAEVARYVDSSGAHIVILQEVDSAWEHAIESNALAYKTVEAAPRDDNFGMMVLVARDSAWSDVLSSRVLRLLPHVAGFPSIELEVEWEGQSLSVLSLHTVPPTSALRAALRDAQIQAAAQWAEQHAVATIVAGDLNATPWSAPFGPLMRDGGLVNSQRGFGVQPTWLAALPLLTRIPLDHVLHSPDLVTVSRALGPRMGSDHRPVHVSLRRQAYNPPRP